MNQTWREARSGVAAAFDRRKGECGELLLDWRILPGGVRAYRTLVCTVQREPGCGMCRRHELDRLSVIWWAIEEHIGGLQSGRHANATRPYEQDSSEKDACNGK